MTTDLPLEAGMTECQIGCWGCGYTKLWWTKKYHQGERVWRARDWAELGWGRVPWWWCTAPEQFDCEFCSRPSAFPFPFFFSHFALLRLLPTYGNKRKKDLARKGSFFSHPQTPSIFAYDYEWKRSGRCDAPRFIWQMMANKWQGLTFFQPFSYFIYAVCVIHPSTHSDRDSLDYSSQTQKWNTKSLSFVRLLLYCRTTNWDFYCSSTPPPAPNWVISDDEKKVVSHLAPMF